MMPVCFGISFTKTFLNQGSSLVHVYTDGSVSVTTGGIEMGQGISSNMISICSSVFGISPDRVKSNSTNTTRIANISPSAASATMNQPLDYVGRLCRERGAYSYVDATASLVGNPLPIDQYQIDVCTVGLQKCLGGPSGSAPITISDAVAELIKDRWHVEKGIEPAGFVPGKNSRIQSNYFDLAMIMAYWSPQRLNHHTEATSMLYCARECARCVLEEGLQNTLDRHALASRAMVAGLETLGLRLFGNQKFKMTNVTGVYIPEGIDGEAIRRDMLLDFGVEIGTSFGPLHGKIWRIGAMGFNARKDAILRTLASLSSVLKMHGYPLPGDDAAAVALQVYRDAE